MKLILSHYLRTLRERDEFDRLLPELIVEMGYVPIGKPQTGVRQYGVDFAAVGTSPEDGIREVLLFVIKQGDIGRNEWSGDAKTSVHPTLIEALDVYLTTHLSPDHQLLRKVIILTTTGDLKQEIQLNWKGFIDSNRARAKFEFWSGEHVAGLLESYLLNENLFASEDRSDLRKALALAGDRDYDFRDFLNLLRRQLGLNVDGSLVDKNSSNQQLLKAIHRVNLAAQVCARWAQEEGDRRQALWIVERTLLWCWHRIQFLPANKRSNVYGAFLECWVAYTNAAKLYVDVIQPYTAIEDGMAGHCRESAEFSLELFEHIGFLATIGFSQLLLGLTVEGESFKEVGKKNAEIIGHTLTNILRNNSAAASPRLDRNATEICLALVFLVSIGENKEASSWLREIAYRLNFCFMRKRSFPIGTDSLDDLVDFEVNPDDAMADKLMSTSWMLSTVASWCAILGLEDAYTLLSRNYRLEYSNVCPQLWHPTEDWPKLWYYQVAYYDTGVTEAPVELPDSLEKILERMRLFNQIEEYNWVKNSQTSLIGLRAIDLIAVRHFGTPLPPSFWFKFAETHQINIVLDSNS